MIHPRQLSIPKQQPRKAKAKKGGRARPDEPLATYCQVAHPGTCTGRAAVRHHIRRRSQGGSDDASNTTDSCDACHRYIHANPAWAKAHGWLRSRWGA